MDSNNWIYMLISCIILKMVKVQATEAVKEIDICYDSTLEDNRLKTPVLKSLSSKDIFDMIDCLMECATEPCCRSINYKKTWSSQNETNCELLHNLVYNTSKKWLEKSSSYDHVSLVNPQKTYNESCLPKDINECSEGTSKCHQNATCTNTFLAYDCECNPGYIGNGINCTAEPPAFTKQLGEWLPQTGNWSICWRATRDGWDGKIFHRGCDSKNPLTLTVVKVVKNHKTFVFGGYATEKWEGPEVYTSASGSFLFSLRNNDGLSPFKSPVKKHDWPYAIFRNNYCGPSFGDDLFILLTYNNDAVYQNFTILGSNYEAPVGYEKNEPNTNSLLAGSKYFTPAEVEVLYLLT